MRFLKLTSIQRRLGAIILLSLLLLMVFVGSTNWRLENQDQDAHTINLAGRQRMLIQQISGLMIGADNPGDPFDPANLTKSSELYTQTLSVLQNGGTFTDYSGQEVTLTRPSDPVVQVELSALNSDWIEFKPLVDQVIRNGPISAGSAEAQTIEQSTHLLVDQADRVAKAFEQYSNRKLTSLITFQFVFLGFGLSLLGAGWWMTYRSIVLPLRNLEESTKRIGTGNLSTPVKAGGPDEIQVLSSAMDSMREQLAQSRQELENWAVELENRVKLRTRELEALSEVSLEISSHLDLKTVLQSVTEKAQSLLGSEVASLCLLDCDGAVLQLQSIKGPREAINQRVSPVVGSGAASILRQNGANACHSQSCANICAILHPEYRTSHLAAPLRSGEKVIGTICVGSTKPNAFGTEAEIILTQMGYAAASALENTRLYEQAEHAAMLEERQRLASDMHDGLLQTLSFQQWMVRLAEEQLANGSIDQALLTLGQIERANGQADAEIRQAIASLQEELPQHSTLQQQLEDLARSLADSKVPILFNDRVLFPLVLSHQASEQVLRVVREAVMNAQRYSQAEEILVHLEYHDSKLMVEVEDYGVGFGPMAEPEDDRPHFGLKIMRARAARLNGQLDIQSNPGRGTLVRLTWPYPLEEHANLGSER